MIALAARMLPSLTAWESFRPKGLVLERNVLPLDLQAGQQLQT